MSTHTHTGECQICGRTQAVRNSPLPEGRLMAKHGYTVEWNCFNGTCWGADYLPLQLSKDLLEKAIQMSRDSIADLKARIQTERDKNPKHGYVSVWVNTPGYTVRGHAYPVACEFRDVPAGSHKRVEAYALGDNAVTGKRAGEMLDEFDSHGHRDANAAALKSRENRIAELQAEISQHERYITWQKRRIRDWKPRELTPVTPEREKRQFKRGDQLQWNGTQITLTRAATGTMGQHIGWWAKAPTRDKEMRFTTRELRALDSKPEK